MQTGFKYALVHGYHYVIQMDADGQHDPACARALIAPVLAGDADVTIGSRFLGKATYPTLGVYEWEGKTWYLRGHVHDESCVHVLRNGRWYLREPDR